MAGSNHNNMLLNGAGVLAIVLAVGYAVADLFSEEKAPTCRELYPVPTAMALTSSDGRPLDAIELQARAGQNEWGVLENARVVKGDDGPPGGVLEVKLANPAANAVRVPGARGGVGLAWRPFELSGSSAACLGYDLYLPEDFKFGAAGVLPGLFGEWESPDDGTKDAFSARLTWRTDGQPQVNLKTPHDKNAGGQAIAAEKMSLPRGRWFSVLQEVVLNTPGQADGALRLWIDDYPVVAKGGLTFRREGSLEISGVIGEIGYGTVDRTANAPADAALRISPFTLSWK
jgi:hypothetical protein